MDKLEMLECTVASIKDDISDAASDNSLAKAQYMQGFNHGLMAMKYALVGFIEDDEVNDKLNELIDFALHQQVKRLDNLQK